MLPYLDCLPRTSRPIAPPLIHLCPPPLKSLHPAWIYKPEEHDHQSKSQPRIQRCTKRHRVLRPPGVCPPFDDIVEDEADESPDGEVEAGSRGDPADGTEEDREVDLAHDAAFAVARVEPEDDGCDGADGEAPHEDVVGGFGAKELLGADDAPENAAIEMHASDWADEAVYGVGCAYERDIGEHPVEDDNLRKGRHNCSCHLHSEQRSRWNLHVMAKLQVGRELNTLR